MSEKLINVFWKPDTETKKAIRKCKWLDRQLKRKKQKKHPRLLENKRFKSGQRPI